MISKWLKQLSGRIEEGEDSPADDRLAAVTLLYEVARADGDIASSELEQLMALLLKRWGLSGEAASELLDSAHRHAHTVTDYHELVTTLRNHWNAEKRTLLIHDMWQVAHADDEKHHYEEHVIRKVADLLYVPHSEFIRGKLNSQPGR